MLCWRGTIERAEALAKLKHQSAVENKKLDYERNDATQKKRMVQQEAL